MGTTDDAPEVPASGRIGRFVVIRRVGTGGMGHVYAAYDEQLDRRVAVKVLHRKDEHSRRVLDEAQAMARLSHPNVVQVFEVGDHDGSLFLAMEFVQGETLAVWQEGRSWKDVLAAYLQAGEGLSAAHEAGVVHRDFKPPNAMVDAHPDGRFIVRVLDFGVAHRTTPDDAKEPSTDGTVQGTPGYMAPEQFQGLEITPAADQFSFCVALWEALYAMRPFGGGTLLELMASVVGGDIRDPPRKTSVPGWLRAIVRRGLSVDPGGRFASMRELLDALGRDPARARARWLKAGAGLAVVGAAGLGVAGWLRVQSERCSGAEAQMDGVWDTSRRSGVEAALVATGFAHAHDVWGWAAADLDRYATAWKEMHTDACKATTIRGEQSQEAMQLRMQCLGILRVQLGAVVDVLLEPDAKTLNKLPRIIGSLPPTDSCADVSALRVELGAPSTSEAEAVANARSLLAKAGAWESAGRLDDAGAALAEARLISAGLQYAPLHAEVDRTEGDFLMSQGKYAEAEAMLRGTLAQAAENRQWRVLGHVASTLTYLVGNLQGKYDEGLRYAELARGLTKRDPGAFARSQSAYALLLFAKGDYAEAEAEHRRALQLWTDVNGPEHPKVAVVRSHLASALSQQRKHVEAEAEYRRALAVEEKALGPWHPIVGDSLMNLALILRRVGRYDEAARSCRRALEVHQSAYGEAHPFVLRDMATLALVEGAQGHHKEAGAWDRKAIALGRKLFGPDDAELAVSHNNLANTLLNQGKLDEARAEAQRAVEIWEGLSHRYLAVGLTTLARVRRRDGAYDEAERHCRKAVALSVDRGGGHHAEALATLARILLDDGRGEEALPIAKQAVDAFAALDAGPGERLGAVLALNKALFETAPDAKARAAARDVVQQAVDLAAKLPSRHWEVEAEAAAWLRTSAEG